MYGEILLTNLSEKFSQVPGVGWGGVVYTVGVFAREVSDLVCCGFVLRVVVMWFRLLAGLLVLGLVSGSGLAAGGGGGSPLGSRGLAQEGGGGVLVVGGVDSLVLVEGGGSRSFGLGDWFSGEGLSFETTVSGGVGVVVVSVVDGRLVVGGVGAGSASVSVRALDGLGGSGVVMFSVVVLESPGFTDTVGHTHEVGIARFVAEGVVRGCNPPANDRFCPDRFLSREEMATVMVRKFGLAVSGDTGPVFEDTGDSVHRSNIGVFAAEGITRGCNPPVNDRFCPNRVVSRGEFASFLVRVLGLVGSDDGGFTDTAGSVHRGNIGLIAGEGITRGCNPPANTRFCPGRGLSRGEVATLLSRVESTGSGGGDVSSSTAIPSSVGPVGVVPPVPSGGSPGTVPPQSTPTVSTPVRPPILVLPSTTPTTPPPQTTPTSPPTTLPDPELSVSVSEEFLDEADTRSATVSVSVSGSSFASERTVTLGFSGSATKDTDYTASAESVTIPAGHTGAVSDTVTLTLGDNGDYEGTEEITVSATLDGETNPTDTTDIKLYDSVKPTVKMYIDTRRNSYPAFWCFSGNLFVPDFGDVTEPTALPEGVTLYHTKSCYVNAILRISEVPITSSKDSIKLTHGDMNQIVFEDSYWDLGNGIISGEHRHNRGIDIPIKAGQNTIEIRLYAKVFYNSNKIYQRRIGIKDQREYTEGTPSEIEFRTSR